MTDKKKVLGIVAEYNPFHNGHAYHLRKSKELTGADTTVAVMSGDFVQRGEPALTDKWKRAETALRNGVDLVVELPFLYACNSAEYFAFGAVRLLESMGVVDWLSFGSEEGKIDGLEKAAEVLSVEPQEYKRYLREAVDSGISFPAAREKALASVAGEDCAALLHHPNNILGIEYLKQLKLQGSGMKPLTFKRTGAGYHESDPGTKVAGASAIRDLFLSGSYGEALEYMPEAGREYYVETGENLENSGELMSLDRFFTLVAYMAWHKEAEELGEIMSASEGLEFRLKKALDKAYDMKSLVKGVKSKRYTETRVCRFLLHTLFGITKKKFAELSGEAGGYIRVLAMNLKGRALLKEIKSATVGDGVVVTNLSRQRLKSERAAQLLELDVLASDTYNLVRSGAMGELSDYRKKPFVQY
ncbi:UPF0348 protein [Clostridia bacterium]|nr:UPF0348 protein [Clostridia bacterium]